MPISSIRAVSYTHLDVYKRQIDGYQDGTDKFCWMFAKAAPGFAAISSLLAGEFDRKFIGRNKSNLYSAQETDNDDGDNKNAQNCQECHVPKLAKIKLNRLSVLVVAAATGIPATGCWQYCKLFPVSYTHLDVYKRQPEHF